MKTVFIINNKSNRLAKILPGMEQDCRQNILGDVELVFTERKRHAVELARIATENECNNLIAVGGDGTLHEIVNGIMQSDMAENAYPILGLLPYGSANDFARTARISKSIENLVGWINSSTVQQIDLGKIYIHASGETRYFINIASLGLGPEVVQKLDRSTALFGPDFHYFSNIIKGFLSYKKKEVSCTARNWQWEGKLLQMAVANGCYFGNAICTAPDAQLADGQFQVAIFGNLSIWDYIKNLGNLKKGVKLNHPQVSYFEAPEVIIKSDDTCGVEADGEYVGIVPATISILPKAMRFLMDQDI